MIDLNQAWVRSYLESVTTRITNATDVLEWAQGIQTLTSTHLIPDFPAADVAKEIANSDWARYQRNIQSLGPRILKTKRSGAIGEISWGGNNQSLDERLEQLNLRGIARTAFDDLSSNGIAAAWAYADENTGTNRIQVLGGYKEPIYREDDPAGDVIGLYQAMQEPGETKVRYRVRVYDLEAQSIREWRSLTDPTQVGGPPHNQWDDTSTPRVSIFDTDQGGYPLGEIAQALELLRAEVSTQLRILRVADAHAFPLLWMAGAWEDAKQVGAQTVLVSSDPTSVVGRIEPGDMTALFTLQDRALERIRADLAMPIGSINTGSWPSGEALQQANLAFITSSQDYALLLSNLLTEVVADYATLEGIKDPPPVNIAINREHLRSTISQQVREDFKAGVISLRMAVMQLAPYYPSADSAEVEHFITSRDNTTPVE